MKNSFYGKMEQATEHKAVTINEGVRQFQNYNKAKNLSPSSIRHYDTSIDIFKGFYDCEQQCGTIDENVIYVRTKNQVVIFPHITRE